MTQMSQPSSDQSTWICPACGAVMYPAKLLKGYDKTGEDADRPTCAFHGPRGPFRHIAGDRRS